MLFHVLKSFAASALPMPWVGGILCGRSDSRFTW